MDDKTCLIRHLQKIHITPLGIVRIQKNLHIDEDVISFCQKVIIHQNSIVYKQGKNYYVQCDQILLTIHSSSYTIITAHLLK